MLQMSPVSIKGITLYYKGFRKTFILLKPKFVISNNNGMTLVVVAL